MVEFSVSPQGQLQLKTLASASIDMPPDLRDRLGHLARGDYCRQSDGSARVLDVIEEAALASNTLADLYVKVVQDLQAKAPGVPVQAVGAHGQTIRHRPASNFTLQLINGARIAALSELPTVCDFRSADLALGGQGAPLVPLFHQDALGSKNECRLILNLGGIANLSLLDGDRVRGFDTGPASTLLDAWALKHLGQAYDRSGAWATSGTNSERLLEHFLAEPFFALPAPKSTGRELFSLAWLEDKLAQFSPVEQLSARDIQATLSQLTARSIAQAAQRALTGAYSSGAERKEIAVYACGGGVKNIQLMGDIQAAFTSLLGTPLKLRMTSELGIDPQQMEASAFAWLAWKRWGQQPLNFCPVTGSRRPHIAGALYMP